MMILFERPRCRQNEVRIEKGDIIVNHFNEITKINTIEFDKFFYYSTSKNEYIKELLDVEYGYCPFYLKNKIKSIIVKDLAEEEYGLFDELQIELKSKWNLYLSIYKDEELVNIFLKFGKAIFKSINLGDEFLELFLNQEYDKCYPYFMSKLSNINIKKLESNINKLVCMIGVPTDMLTTSDGEVYSYWNNLIYISTLLYLITLLSDKKYTNINLSVKEIKFIKFCILKYLELFVNKLSYYNSYDILLNMYKSKKIVRKVVSILPVIFSYINNHYGEYVEQYEFWEADNLTDILEDHRMYLINKAKTKEKKDEINSYSYSKLHRSYNRMILGY